MNRVPLRLLLMVGLCFAVLTMGFGATAAEPDRVVFDFESGDLQGWQVVEGQFGDLLGKRPAARYKKQGMYYLTTLEKNGKSNDPMTGVFESPVFVLTGGSVSFLVGGGNHPDTYVALCTEDGREVFQARGKRTEAMDRVTWDTGKLVGKKLFLRIVDQNTGGWGHIALDDFRAEGRIDPKATKARFAARKKLRLDLARKAYLAVSRAAEEPLRAAIEDLIDTFGDGYPKGKEYLARLDRLKGRLEEATGQQADKLRQELAALSREALIANPLVSGRPIVYVARPQYRSDHHNTATMFQTGEINTGSFTGGGAIKTIDFARGEVKTLLESPKGVARDIDVSFDGKKVLFALRHDRQDDYHLYEINADGTGLKQLTFGPGLSDIDPIYLPGGQILFGSTREPKFCMCNRHIMCNLFTMDGDGANIQQIGHSTLHEGHPAVLPDGRIVYDRWEYIDRNFGDAQGVWTCNPDGTSHVVYWGNNTNSPGAVLDNRALPGTERFICTFSSCHDRPWGALAIVDRRLGIDGRRPVVRTWPREAIDLVGKGNYDRFTRVNPKYEDPYPLSDKHFLCSRMTGQGEQMGIFLIDLFGNEILLHAEKLGCFDPMPLGPRTRPPVIPPRIDLTNPEGYFYVADVYLGTGMDAIQRGTVKYLRVVESPEKRFWTQPAWDGGTGQQAPGMAWDDFNNKRILGTVPVEGDGSAYFAVPADMFVYFQLLDEKGMMIQSMRSGTITRPGETGGCVGCHESRRSSIPQNGQTLAMNGPPRKLQPWYGPPRLFNYLSEVQPALDKHCVSCHDYGKEAGKKLNLAGDRGVLFNTSYVELRGKRLVNVPGAGPYQTLMPKSWGSHASKLGQVLLEGHGDPEIDEQVKLDKESFDRIITWIDVNAPYYPDYASAYRGNLFGRSPLDNGQLGRLGQLAGVGGRNWGRSIAVSFTRPEISPCLENFTDKNDPNYKQALGIIRAGQQTLARRPRADMPGFQLVEEIEIEQQAKYLARLKFEKETRTAIAAGRKKYEKSADGGK